MLNKFAREEGTGMIDSDTESRWGDLLSVPAPDTGRQAVSWLGASPEDSRQEKIIGAPDFQDPWFLELGALRSKSVGVIPRFATAFLITDDLIITNHHVLRTAEFANVGRYIALGYENGPGGLAKTPELFELDPGKLFVADEALDYAVCAVTGSPGKKYGHIPLDHEGAIVRESRVNIIQHPNAQLKKIAVRNNEMRFFDESVLQYLTDTEHGSSGSPVFNDEWEIIGLHYRHDKSPQDNIYYNEAQRISNVWEHVKGFI